MNIIFISHSSLNNPEARAVCDWLQEQGWDEVFLDLDPERGIAGGERWESALHRAASHCDAVLFLVSRQWLESEWCRREFHLAQKLNKRCFILLIQDIAIADLPEELTMCWQVVNLAAGTDHGQAREVHLPGSSGPGYVYFSRSALTRLKTGLVKAGLEPKFFAWPPEHDPRRSPYRGLRPLDMADAGIFFGREAPMIDLMARLRGLHGSAPPRFLAILGASGAGKSSFLRAGILPRLCRDERYFYPLPVIRPEQAVLSGNYGLAEALYQACQAKKVPKSRRQIQTLISEGVTALRPLLLELVQAAAVPDLKGSGHHLPQPVLAVDQGEELFMAEGREESRRFLSLLQALLAEDAPPLMVLFTIRSDSYGYLQSALELEGMPQQTFSLPPLPAGAYQKIIEEPARALDGTDRPLALDPKLTQQLLLDTGRSGARDALPLLAFTLGRLYEEYAGDGALRLEEYRDMGGIEGAIQKAVDNALKDARANPALPDKEEECLKLLRRGLIPWMAGIDPETSLPRRRVARLSEVPEEARAVIRHFVEHRLLATDTNDRGEVIIEPAHEALLRQWVTLRGWLAEDTAALSALETLKAAIRDWEANDREAGWLTHQAGRLEDAEALQARKDLAGFLTDSDKDYLWACRKQENELRNRELQQARDLAAARKRTMQRSIAGLAAALVLLVIASGLGVLAHVKSNEATAQQERADAARNAANQVIQVILTDLQGVLIERGMHRLHERINKLAREYFDTYPEDEINDQVLLGRGAALMMSSHSLHNLGQLSEARQAAEQAFVIYHDLLSKQPYISGAVMGLASSALKLGDLILVLDGPAAAKECFEIGFNLAKPLYDLESNVQNASVLAMYYSQLGRVAFRLNDQASAMRYFKEGMKLTKGLYDAEPSGDNVRLLANFHEGIGYTSLQMDDPADAKSHFEAGMKLVKTLYVAEPSARNAGFLSRFHELIGDVTLAFDGPVSATGHFEESMQLIQKLYDAEPSAGNAKDLAGIHKKLGQAALDLNRPDKAKEHYEELVKLRQFLYDAEPNSEIARDLAFSYRQLGKAVLSLDGPAAAREHFEESMKLFQTLYDAEPSAQNAKDLAFSYSELGEGAFALDDPAGAKGHFEKSLKLFQILYKGESTAQNGRDLAIHYQWLGIVARALEDPAAERRYLNELLKLRRFLYDAEPSIQNTRDLASSYSQLGNLVLKLDGPAAAKGNFEESLMLFQDLYNTEPNARNAEDLAYSHSKLGEVVLALDGPAATKTLYEEMVKLRQFLYEAKPSNEIAKDLAFSHFRLGRVLLDLDDPAAAKRHFEEWMRLAQILYKAEPSAQNARFLAISQSKLGEVALALDDPATAKGCFEEQLKLRQFLYEAEPSAQNAASLASAHEDLGDILVALDEPVAAKEHFEKVMTWVQEQYDTEPSAEIERSFAFSHYKMAQVLIAKAPSEDDRARSRHHAREGLQLLLDFHRDGQLDDEARGWISGLAELAGVEMDEEDEQADE